MNIARCVLVVGILTACAVHGCSDTHLYGTGLDDALADRVGLTGRVCTDDPQEAGFPVRVVFLVDYAMGPLFATFDPEQARIRALRDTLALHGGNEAFSFAVVGMGADARLLAPQEGYFTRNPGDLENAVATLALPQGCLGEVCRDYTKGMNLAQSIIEGDLAELNAGERARTQYAVVMMTAGRPWPLSCEFECCDPSDEECDETECVQSWACTKIVLKDETVKLREKIEKKGALSLSMHILFLAATDNIMPPDEIGQVQDLLQQMAFAGAGRFERFDVADAVTLDRIGLLKLSSLLETKSLMVTNVNTLPGLEQSLIDSDGDGLGDVLEAEMLTDPLAPDSDGDGLGDMVETLISFNPLVRDEKPMACAMVLGPPFLDLDSDHLNECEELLLGTDPSLPDTDGDAMIDWIEVALGTDYLRADALDDSDWDGASNGDEVKNHTDPRSSDATSHLGRSYRYQIDDEGMVIEPRISNPRTILGVTVLDAGEETTGGVGWLRHLPGPPHQLSWQDPQDQGPGTPVDIGEAGTFQLLSSSAVDQELERWLSVEVDPVLLPPTAAQELLLVEMSERHCLTFTVRNIQLVETTAAVGAGGVNDLFIYFAQSAKGRLTLPGLFRVAHVPVTYHPDTGRIPPAPLITIKDEEFVAIGY